MDQLHTSKQGAFFVIDGTDGSGKATQTKHLIERLRDEGFSVETISFPQYHKESSGPIRAYLAGEYGATGQDVDPRVASMLYAIDRYDASFQIRLWLNEGKIVVADRYVSSNMGHQGGKISNPIERQKFLAWNDNIEHGLFNIPRPDRTIILSVPAKISYKLAQQGRQEKYKVENDIHEADLSHLQAAVDTYREIASNFPHYSLIDCTQNDKLRSIKSIHEEVWTHISPLISQQTHKEILIADPIVV